MKLFLLLWFLIISFFITETSAGSKFLDMLSRKVSRTKSITKNDHHNGGNAEFREQQEREFQKIAMPELGSTAEQIRSKITLNLLPACEKEVNFLSTIGKNAGLYKPNIVQNAIRRYETCWLPAQANNPNLDAVPPSDVYLVWHAHMLAPHFYRKDCVEICGDEKIVDHKLLSANELRRNREKSKAYWREHCPEEPYKFNKQKNRETNYERKSSYNLALAVDRQRLFTMKVVRALNHYKNTNFLQRAIDRYIKLFLLFKTYPKLMLSPEPDFDLVWHTHQLHPIIYHHDCMDMFGYPIKHDDAIEDSKLVQLGHLTDVAWAHHFDECKGCGQSFGNGEKSSEN